MDTLGDRPPQTTEEVPATPVSDVDLLLENDHTSKPNASMHNADTPPNRPLQLGAEILMQTTLDGPSDLPLEIGDMMESSPPSPNLEDPLMTEENDTISSEEADRSWQMYDLASSILEEYKTVAPLSDLNTAIYLFNESLDRRPAPHPLRSDSLNDLAAALVTRFCLTNQHQDIRQVILIRGEAMREVCGLTVTGGQPLLDRDTSTEYGDMLAADWDDSEASEMSKLAKAIIKNFNQAVQLSYLDIAITVHREALLFRPSPHPNRPASLGSLAVALHSRSCCTERITDLNEAISLLQEAVDICPGPDTRLPDLLLKLSAVLATRFDKTGDVLDLREAMTRYNDFLQVTDANVGEASQLLDFATDLLMQFPQSGQITDLETAISLFREVLVQLPVHHSHKSTALENLATALWTRFEQSGRCEDLDEAILLHQEVLDWQAGLHPDRSSPLNNLANALWTRFEQSGRHEDMEKSILLHREALELRVAPHPERSGSLNNLATALWTRFGQLGRHEDLDEAIPLHREALKLRAVPHPDRSSSLSNLANALKARFGQSGRCEDLDEAISLHREALGLRAAPHPRRSQSLDNLATALKTRFELFGQREDLDEAILLHRGALELRVASHPERSNSLDSLASALEIRFGQSGRQEDLDDAILLHQMALELRAAPHPRRSHSLNNLALVLWTRFGQLSRREDLEQAISLHRDALELLPASHPDRSTSLSNFANALSTRFEQSGQRKDIDEAILFHREALELRAAPDPDRSNSLNNLAIALSIRFELSNGREDLDEAISLFQEALLLRAVSHPNRSDSLNNLANSLRIRFAQSNRHEDLDEAISLHRDALELRAASHPSRSSSLGNLASTLWTRFRQSRRHEDLDEAISLHRDALELLPAHHPDRSITLNNLALALLTQFEQSGRREDLEKAIDMRYQSLDALVCNHPSTCNFSACLGRMLMNAYFHTLEPEYFDNSITAFRAAVACSSAPASERFNAAQSWVACADSLSHESVLEAYRAAIELLPRLAMLALDLRSRQQALASGTDGLARDAAACAIRSGQYDKAVELLETGRAVFWSQALQLRTPMNDLHDVAPELAEKLKHISVALEQGSHRDMSRNLSDTPQKVMSMEKEASHFHGLNDEWLATLDEVRQLDGFRDFMRPSRLSTLQGAAANGPVVILNTSKSGSDALIITLSGVKHIPLPYLSFTAVIKLVELIQAATAPMGGNYLPEDANSVWIEELCQKMPALYHTTQFSRLSVEARHAGRVSDTQMQPEDAFRFVLAVLWTSAVEPIVCSLKLEKSETPPNLRWCPTGPFSFLPIHAAGLYDTEMARNVSEYVVSSYVPTIGAFLTAMKMTTLPIKPFKMMVVIQPQTLPCTIHELRKIETRVPNECLIRLGIPEMPASVERVISHLSAASIAHFACHGQQNTRSPLDSALLLEDGQLKVSQIMQQSMPNSSLAFLCACETAMGDENLPDEVIHLGATLLFTGFRGVIATMWSISDIYGPKIADSFYENLFKDTTTVNSHPDTTEAARALHCAVIKLRSEGASFVHWVPFIHLGM